MRRVLLALPLGALVLACSHAQPAPSNLSASAAEGHKLYLAKCQMCHELVEPTEFTRAQWPEKLPVFAKRAKLKPEEYDEILAYLSESGRP
jgi:cytochrome c5